MTREIAPWAPTSPAVREGTPTRRVAATRRSRAVAVAAVLAASLAVAACGGGAAPASTAHPTQKATQPAPAKAPAASQAAPAQSSTSGGQAAGAIPTIPPGHPVTLTTAYSVPSAIFTPVWIAVDKGYFKKFGLDVHLERIEGAVQIAGIVSGHIQVGNTGGAELLDSRAKGANVFALMEATHYAAFELHGSPAYKTVMDFKGKTVAITRAGSSTDLAALVLLTKYGLTPGKDVHILSTGGMPTILAAMEKGVAQGGVLSPPTTLKADKAGFPMVVSAIQAKVPLQMNMIVTTGAFAKAHPAAVYAYMKGYLQGLADFFQKPNEAIAEIAKYTKTSTAVAKGAYEAVKPAMVKLPYVTNDGLQTVQKYGTNKATRTLDVSQAHNDSYLRAVISSGYLKQIGLQ